MQIILYFICKFLFKFVIKAFEVFTDVGFCCILGGLLTSQTQLILKPKPVHIGCKYFLVLF